ncbi:MAG: HEAT repeat domain-containing protein, partial [Planctomycetota bacterium]|nr:HEAT repeat domain-containing protein [Planctomycetota bacterium]
MLTTLSLTTLALIFAQSEDLPPEDTPPTPQEQEQPTIEPAEALDKIKAAIKSDGEAVILDAIEVCADVKDKKVITEIAKLLKHKSEDIRYAALEALRFNEHQESLKRLLAFGKNKIFKSDVEYHIEYIYALGQKADKKAAKLITEDFTVSSNSSEDLLKARIYSLGRIRDVDSIEKLLQFSKSSFRGQRRRSSPKITQPVQTSLAVLTGVELGNELYA